MKQFPYNETCSPIMKQFPYNETCFNKPGRIASMCVVKEKESDYVCIVRVLPERTPTEGTGDKLRVDQAHLETVLPPGGSQRPCVLLSGAQRGCLCRVLALDVEHATCDIRVEGDGAGAGSLLRGVPFDQVSKLHEQT